MKIKNIIISSLLVIGMLGSSPLFSQKVMVIVEPNVSCVDGTAYPYNQIHPGDTLYFRGGLRQNCLIRNFTGSYMHPITFMNYNGPVKVNTNWNYGIVLRNCKFVRLTGTGDLNYFYGFMIQRVKNGAGLSIGDLSSFVEVDHISIDSVPIAGIYAKTDPDCSFQSTRDKFTQYNTIIHDCFISNTGDEGMYLGSSFYSGETIHCNGKDTLVYPHLLSGVRVYNNIVKYTGWDGIQVGSASTNCQIFNNLVMYDSQSGTNYQMSGILIGGGSQCDCYNNYIYKGKGDGIESLGLGDYRIFNNVIVDAGRAYYPNDPTKMKYGIYVNDNSAKPGSSFTLLFNDIINPKSNGVRFSSVVTKKNLIASNAIINPGLGSNAYIVITNPGSDVLVKSNYTAPNSNNAGFIDTTYKLSSSSPLIDNGYADARRVYFDYFYRPRPVGNGYDIGIYEYNPAFPGYVNAPGMTDSLTERDSLNVFTVEPTPFPNPVNHNLNINFTLSRPSDVELIIYNLQGTGLFHEDQFQLKAGEHTLKVETTNYQEGVYLFTIRSDKSLYSGKFYKVK